MSQKGAPRAASWPVAAPGCGCWSCLPPTAKPRRTILIGHLTEMHRAFTSTQDILDGHQQSRKRMLPSGHMEGKVFSSQLLRERTPGVQVDGRVIARLPAEGAESKDGKALTTREASRLSSSTASTSEALVAIEMTYADRLSGPRSAATLKVSNTCASMTGKMKLLPMQPICLEILQIPTTGPGLLSRSLCTQIQAFEQDSEDPCKACFGWVQSQHAESLQPEHWPCLCHAHVCETVEGLLQFLWKRTSLTSSVRGMAGGTRGRLLCSSFTSHSTRSSSPHSLKLPNPRYLPSIAANQPRSHSAGGAASWHLAGEAEASEDNQSKAALILSAHCEHRRKHPYISKLIVPTDRKAISVAISCKTHFVTAAMASVWRLLSWRRSIFMRPTPKQYTLLSRSSSRPGPHTTLIRGLTLLYIKSQTGL